MRKTIDETNRRRAIQTAYNIEHNQVPTALKKAIESNLPGAKKSYNPYESNIPEAAEPKVNYTTEESLKKGIGRTRKEMEKAAKALDFIAAARLRDNMTALEERLKKEYK